MKTRTFTELLILLLGLSSCSEKAEESKQTPPVLVVDYLVANTTTEENTIRIPGTLMPFEHVDLYAEINGLLTSIHFIEGQQVAKGQLLFKIDTEVQEAQLKQVASDLDFAKKDEQRKKALLEAKSISLEDYELALAKKMNLEAQSKILEVQIGKGKIVAPFSGTIGFREVSEGALIGPGTKLTSLSQNNRLKLEFNLPERFSSTAQIGTIVQFSDGKEMFDAKIYATSPTIDAQNRMLTVRAETTVNKPLIPGAFVEVAYMMAADEDAIIVPATTLVPVLNGQKIWKINQGQAQSVLVEPGLRNKQNVQIFGDIKPGDTIITSGLLGIREGMYITIRKP